MAKYVSKQIEVDAFQVIAGMAGGPLQCDKGDWLVQLPSGTITIMEDAQFKRNYELKQEAPKPPLIRSAVQPALKPEALKAWPKEFCPMCKNQPCVCGQFRSDGY